jgi:hypothetical protein
VKVTASATIGGKKTNRVKLTRRYAHRGPPTKSNKVERLTPQTKTRTRRGTPQNPDGAYVVLCISAYPSDLVEMDLLAEQLGLSRSALIRKAVKALKNNTPQAQMWKAALR